MLFIPHLILAEEMPDDIEKDRIYGIQYQGKKKR